MWTKSYWQAVGERMIRGGAIAVATAFFVGDQALNALEIEWIDVGGFFLGGAFTSLVFSLGGNAISGNGPSFTRKEEINPNPKPLVTR